MPGPTTFKNAEHDVDLNAAPPLDLGPGICADDEQSRTHEWLLTNGRGGYACGSIAGVLDRRYHAVLAAAVNPPDTRTVVMAKFDERLVEFDDEEDVTLTTDSWGEDGLTGFGHRHLIRFRMLDGVIDATWLIGRTRITRRMVMPHGHDAIIAEYRVEATDRPVKLAVKMIGGNRSADFLATGAKWKPSHTTTTEDALTMVLPETVHGGMETDLSIRVKGGVLTPRDNWYRDYFLRTEETRGYDDKDDHLNFAEATATLEEGDVLRIEVAAGVSAGQDWRTLDPFASEQDRQARLMASSGLAEEPPLVRELVRASDQFVVSRPIPDAKGETGASIIAGYPWFTDWGRDTMISLPGICLATNRLDEAKQILTTFAGFIDQGMLPNRFPGKGEPPEYNTVDASLLFIEAIGRTWRSTHDQSFLRSILPAIDEILTAYRDGTRHGIKADPTDGLVTQGEQNLQLTWMDARIGNTVVTPRRGKAVEINALWHSAWRWRAEFAAALGEDDDDATRAADRIRASFAAFNDGKHPYLADVIDGEHGVDYSLRPNQLFATGCAHPPVEGELAASTLATCETFLLDPVGLRTLPADDARYQGHYEGSQAKRDAAYHMGTSWPWLLGPYLRSHLRIRQDPDAVRLILGNFISEITRRGLGSISEVHDGDDPHTPGGCIAQAWSVGEVLATWIEASGKAPWRPHG